MPQPAEWRRPGAPASTRADLAWEFLRRDPGYLAAYERMMARPGTHALWTDDEPDWGLVFPADPQAVAGLAGVYWRGDVAPAVVVEVEPRLGRSDRGLDLSALPWPQRGEGGVTHLRAPGGLQVRVLARDLRQPLAAVAPLGADFEVRLRTLGRLQDALRGRAAGRDFTPQQLRRLRLGVQALDGRVAGLSHREIATDLFGAAAVAREPWKSSSVRDTTQRLVGLAERLQRGGYRSLLQTRPR